MKHRIPALAVALLAAIVGATSAYAQGTYRVTITNITANQVISPPVVVTHSAQVTLFRAGRQASAEIAAMAEDADTSGLLDTLAASDQVHDFTIADGPLPPGRSVVLEVEATAGFLRLSAVGMLVTTNDAFFGLNTYNVAGGPRVRSVTVPAYDAGSEANNELCSHIPGPPCGNGGVRETDGAEGFVHVHRGIHGIGDLASFDADWRNPVVRISIVRN